MMRSAYQHSIGRGRNLEGGGDADLQTDVMRFMAILALCLVVVFALVQSIPLTAEETVADARTDPAPVVEPVPTPEPIPEPEPVAERAPAPSPEPVSEPERVPEHEPIREPETVAAQEPVPRPAPAATPEPVPEPASNPAPTRVAAAPKPELPEPARVSAAPQPLPDPEPVAEPLSAMSPQPDPAPQPEPEATPAVQNAPGADEPAGFTLQFESDSALTRLVARNEVGLYAIGTDRALRMNVNRGRFSFWPASTPNEFHEMNAATVPADVLTALERRADSGGAVKWGVTLPATMQRDLNEMLQSADGGALFIAGDGRLRLEE